MDRPSGRRRQAQSATCRVSPFRWSQGGQVVTGDDSPWKPYFSNYYSMGGGHQCPPDHPQTTRHVPADRKRLERRFSALRVTLGVTRSFGGPRKSDQGMGNMPHRSLDKPTAERKGGHPWPERNWKSRPALCGTRR
jgi:hypothetical protein